MVCPVCTIDQQRIRLDQHLAEEHNWPLDKVNDYYNQQIQKLLNKLGPNKRRPCNCGPIMGCRGMK